MTVKLRKFELVAALSSLAVWIYVAPCTLVGTVLKVYVRSRYTMPPAWRPEAGTTYDRPLATVRFEILSDAEKTGADGIKVANANKEMESDKILGNLPKGMFIIDFVKACTTFLGNL